MVGTGEQLQNSRLGLLSAPLEIHCVILGKSPNCSGPQLPYIWQTGLILKFR